MAFKVGGTWCNFICHRLTFINIPYKMKDSNYYVIHGWMINRLKLKGNRLSVFAVVYGFSQDCESKFTGSLKYLQEATNASKNTIISSLQSLEEDQLILKFTQVKNNIKFCEYSHNEQVVQKLNHHSSETSPGGAKTEPGGGSEIARGGGAKIEPNNTNLDNIVNNKEDNYPQDLFGQQFEVPFLPKDILKYLNEKKPSKLAFKMISKNLDPISARIKEGFKKNDFINVINYKIEEWKNDDKMKKYIRPETLFGNKMEKYLMESQEDKSTDGSENFKYNPKQNASLA